MKSRLIHLVLLCGITTIHSLTSSADTPEPTTKSSLFADVRPILSDHCFACHGPDEHDRRAGLRLDTADGIDSVIDSDDLDSSELLARLVSDDPDQLMPPPEFNKPLSKQQRKTLQDWVKSGGAFKGHWAFQPPVKATVPEETRNAIDFFIDRGIERQGLTKNEPADDRTLLRRLCLDLTGLPPTREQIDRLGDQPLNVEALVDHLMDSPAFGQHYGRYWLDLVRYADTHGLHLDNYREMWPYRDWVIDAVNQNMPFDQFVVTQLAGDLLPDATDAQKIASGFNRLNVTTNEGGSIYDEVFARNVIDRTDAFGTIFMGLTTQCAVCHDHKFDPITQKDYYSLFAFFNSLDGRALDGNKKDHPPTILVPIDDQAEQLAELDQQIAQWRREQKGDIESVDQAQRQWELSFAAHSSTDDAGGDDRESSGPQKPHEYRVVPSEAITESGNTLTIEKDGTIRSSQQISDRETQTLIGSLPLQSETGENAKINWQSLRLDVLANPQTERAGTAPNGNAVLSEITVATRSSNAAEKAGETKWKRLKIGSAVADVEQSNGSFQIANAIDGKTDAKKGWAIHGHGPKGGRTASFAIAGLADRIESGDDQIRVELKFQSVHVKHQFHAVRLNLSDSPVAVAPQAMVELGDVHSIGPFGVESIEPGFYRKFASQEDEFKPDEVFAYQDIRFQWTPRDDLTAVDVHRIPTVAEGVSVNVIHQSIESPKKQTIDLLLGTTDGHSIFLNKKRLADWKRTGALVPLNRTYKLELRKGHNDLYIKTVSSSESPQLAFAYRSPAIATPPGLAQLARIEVEERSAKQIQSLRKYYRDVVCDHPDWLALKDMIGGAETARKELVESIPTTLIWKELAEPREANLLVRGQYDQPGEVVPRNTPTFLPPMPEGAPRDRLGLAQWLMSDDHPLTARVAVNRYWQAIFGAGLVKSSEDFGNQGETPSHPELLDWLAVDFRENGWDVKRLIRQMVTSNAYLRGALVREADRAKDPENRFFARGPRHRLDAEVLRDQALSLAGLIREDAGGPSVKPPQPNGLWYAVGYTRSNTANFKPDVEESKVFRRSVYIFWKRSSAPPQMSTFDAPSRESCTARRERTNTPLQALLLMNEQQYLQAAKQLAKRAFTECKLDAPTDKLAWLFETVTARKPTLDENIELQQLLQHLVEHYEADQESASEILSVDETPLKDVTDARHAAWMMIASTLLNLDEVINK